MVEPASEPTSPSTDLTKGEPLPVPGLPPDWHLKATDKIVSTVDQVRVKTSGPALRISRAVVFGLLGGLLSLIGLIVLLIGIIRLLNIALPQDVWLVYMILGALFAAIGTFLWWKRPRHAAS